MLRDWTKCLYRTSHFLQQELKKKSQQIPNTVFPLWLHNSASFLLFVHKKKNVSFIYFQAANVLPCRKKMVLRHQHPVRLFPRNKTSGELAPPAEQPPTAESGRIEKHEIAVRTCNFCLQTPCISVAVRRG